jgi:hypothetical protein
MFIIVDNTAEYGMAGDRTLSRPTRKGDRDPLTEPLMWPTLVLN